MSELSTYAELGFRHITDPNGADHILFLLALAAVYRWADWRRVALVVTAFTVGHTLTLALAVSGALQLPSGLIEFLIPVTVAVTALENMMSRPRAGSWRVRFRPLAAAMFGLVHGAGFANYLQSLFVEQVAIPLLGFNIGLEVGQLLVLTLALTAFGLVDRSVAWWRHVERGSALRVRTVTVSATVAIVAARWALERTPW